MPQLREGDRGDRGLFGDTGERNGAVRLSVLLPRMVGGEVLGIGEPDGAERRLARSLQESGERAIVAPPDQTREAIGHPQRKGTKP